MRSYRLNSTGIALVLARTGHDHECQRCQRPMWVRYESGLCVYCFNAARELTSRVEETLEAHDGLDALAPLTV